MRRFVPFLLVALAACNEGTIVPTSTRATLLLTDAPGDVEAVWVDILHAYIRGDGEPIDLLDGPTGLVELTALAVTPLALADGVELPPGTYREIRFVIGEAVLESTDGGVFSKDGAEHPGGLESTGTLHCPSCSQSGLKVKLPEDLALEEGGFIVVADFDVSQSFGKERGNSGRWVMKPTIHAAALGSGASVEGSVELATDVSLPECPAGTAQDLTAFIPVATARTSTDEEGDPVVRTGHTKHDGSFAIQFLGPDTYDLGHEAAIEIEDHVLSIDATVSQPTADLTAGGTVEDVVYTITGATCQPPA